MQREYEAFMSEKPPSVLRAARKKASVALCGENILTTAVITYLFCVVSIFALVFSFSALSFFLIPDTLAGVLVLWGIGSGIAVAVVLTLLCPLCLGRARMMGMVAAGKAVTTAELFHYFTTWHLWRRGVKIGLLVPVSLLLPPFFAVVAIATGNEELPVRRALSLSRGYIPCLTVLRFWGFVLLRLLRGLLTLGLLWLLYDAHHVTVTYFSMMIQPKTEETV